MSVWEREKVQEVLYWLRQKCRVIRCSQSYFYPSSFNRTWGAMWTATDGFRQNPLMGKTTNLWTG